MLLLNLSNICRNTSICFSIFFFAIDSQNDVKYIAKNVVFGVFIVGRALCVDKKKYLYVVFCDVLDENVIQHMQY